MSDQQPAEDSAPELDESSASDVDAIAGIVVEVRDTAGASHSDDIEAMLRRRLAESSVEVSEDDVQNLVQQIREGD